MRQFIRHPAIKNIDFIPTTLVTGRTVRATRPAPRNTTTSTTPSWRSTIRLAIYDPADGGNIDDLDPEDYQHWCELEDKLKRIGDNYLPHDRKAAGFDPS